MHSCTRWSRCGANVNIARRCCIMSPRGPKQKLADVHGPARDITSYKVRVHALEICGSKNATRQNTVAKAGSETLDLIFQFLKHVYRRSMRHMAVRPRRMFVRRSSRLIEKTRLGQQNERVVGMLSVSDCRLRRGDFLKAAAEMHGHSSRAGGCFPGDGCAQCIIHFEDSGSIAVSFE